MLRAGIIFLTGWLAVSGAARADDKVVQSFDGTAAQTTPAFQVQDGWKVHWDSADAVQITVLAADGSTVAEVTAAQTGSLGLPKGGTYSLKIFPVAASDATPWHIHVAQSGASAASSAAGAATVSSQSFSLNLSTNSPLAVPSGTPVPDVANLTQDESRALVLVKGDRGEGTGFLIKTPDGPAVVTNQHVLFANPNVKITTTTGEQVQTLGLKGASDRDLAMFSIQDDHYSYLDLATDDTKTAQVGDDVITPGDSEGGEVMLSTKGMVLGFGPDRVEVTNPVFHGNSGGPVLHVKSGKVLGVVTFGVAVKPSDESDKISLASKDSAIAGTMRYFALRLDTVPHWEPLDWPRFLNETTFINNFHDLSRCIDSFMNGAQYERAHVASESENGRPTAHYYLKNAKLQTIYNNYHEMSADADQSQKIDARRETVMDLQGLAATDMDTIQDSANFYSYNQVRAGYEVKYRKWLQQEIDNFGDKISDMGH